MSDRLQIIDPDSGRSRALPVADDVCFVTVTAGGDVDLRAEAAGAVLRLVRIEGGYRVEPAAAGGHVVVNGQELYCKDLAGGDVVELGHAHLRWLPGAPRPAPPRPAARGAMAARGRPARGADREPEPAPARRRAGRRRGGVPGWLVPLSVAALCVLGLWIVLRMDWATRWPSTPQHYVDLAQSQFASGQPDKALATLEIALRSATGRTRETAERLRSQIQGMVVELAASRELARAERDLDLVHSFRSRYLQEGAGRPAAREFVRLCDQWLHEHRERCRSTAAGNALADEVEELRRSWYPRSGLPAPDDADDVLFAARARLRFQIREYRQAVALLDAFVAHGGPEVERVGRERAELLAEGEEWLRGRLRVVERMIERGERSSAEELLRGLERHAVLAQWQELVEPVRRRLH